MTIKFINIVQDLKNICCNRLVEEDDTYRIYYSCENSKEYHEYELQFLEVDAEFIPAIKMIIKKYPQYVRVEDLPINDLDKKVLKIVKKK